jgi:PAS domain S-box-containing protein
MMKYDPLILIVHDDLDMLDLIQAQIQAAGYSSVMTAVDGEQALVSIKQRRPDVVVSDIAMPNIDGFQLCRILKSPLFQGNDNIPVILTSATYRDVVAEQVAHNVHAFAYLQQPHEPSALLHLIDLALEKVKPVGSDESLLRYVGNLVIIDDDPDMVSLLEATLRSDEWNVRSALNWETAERILSEPKVQVVLLDYHIPDVNGIEPLLWIKEHCPHAVVIMMTADNSEELVIHLIKSGADDYLRKPFELETVSTTCRNALNKYNFLRIHEQFQEKIDKLRSVSDYLDLLITYSQEAIFSCDVNGLVRIWNRGAEKMYGYTAQEIVGSVVDDFLDPPDFKRKSHDVMKMLEEKGSFVEPEILRRKKNNEVFPVSATYSSIQNSQGEFIGFSVIERDVTAVRELESEKIKSARLRAITQTAVTANDHINTPLGVILGYSQLLQRKIQNLSPEDVGALDTIQQQVLKIKGIMNKLKLMSDPIVKNYSIEGVTMLDLSQSK